MYNIFKRKKELVSIYHIQILSLICNAEDICQGRSLSQEAKLDAVVLAIERMHPRFHLLSGGLQQQKERICLYLLVDSIPE